MVGEAQHLLLLFKDLFLTEKVSTDETTPIPLTETDTDILNERLPSKLQFNIENREETPGANRAR